MKRAAQLIRLSHDHHQGLVLAREAVRDGARDEHPPSVEAWNQLRRRFEDELEPHFQVEETFLAEPLEAHEPLMAQRLRDEHAELRRIVAPESDRSSASLRRFGELLEQHIRFEERELFEAAQRVLSVEELDAVSRARGE